MNLTNTASNPFNGVIASLLLVCTVPATADFISRDGAITMESSMIWGREDDDHFIDAEGPCESLENPDPNRFRGYAGYGLEIELPEEEDSTGFDSEARACTFDYRDEDNGRLGSSKTSAHLEYMENWTDETLVRSTLSGTQGIELHTVEQDEVSLRPLFSESAYFLEFSIDLAGHYLLRAMVYPTQGVEFLPFPDMDALLTMALRDSNLSGPTLSAHLDRETGIPTEMEMLVELMPGDHSLRVENRVYFDAEDAPPGSAVVSFDFVADFVWCQNVGTEGNDDYIGSTDADTFCMLGGNDRVSGGGGADLIFAGAGDDVLVADGDDGIEVHGGDGDDVIVGGGGNDILFGGAGVDTINGDGGSDFIDGGEDDDDIFGDEGDDEILGGGGHDVILGLEGNDLIHGGEGDDQIDGDEGEDEIHGEAGFDKINGGDGDDLIFGGDRKDVIHGDDGDDFIDGEDGDDVLYGDNDDDFIMGGTGRDEIHGGRGKDELYGDKANDAIFGGPGGDIIEGGQGHDALEGGDNRDRIIGNGGNDFLVGDGGRDRMRAGPGNDQFIANDGLDDFLNCGAGTDDASLSDPDLDTRLFCEIVP